MGEGAGVAEGAELWDAAADASGVADASDADEAADAPLGEAAGIWLTDGVGFELEQLEARTAATKSASGVAPGRRRLRSEVPPDMGASLGRASR
jgi:hypothetical protein